MTDLAVLVQYNYAKGEHLTRFLEQNDTAFGCPWGTGISGTNGIACGNSGGAGLTSVESTAKSSYNGVTFGLTKRYAAQLPVPGQLHAVLGQVRRRQRARPVHLPLHRLQQPRRRVRLLGPRPAPPAERGAALARARPGEREPALLVPLGTAAVAERDGRRCRRPSSARPPTASGPTARSSSATRAARTTSTRRSTCASRASSGSASACRSSRSSRSSTCSTAKNLLAPADHQPGLQLRRHDHERPRRSAPGAARSTADLVTHMGPAARPAPPFRPCEPPPSSPTTHGEGSFLK